MKYFFCFEVELTDGDVEFYNVSESSRERAFMYAALAFGARARGITLTVIMEPV